MPSYYHRRLKEAGIHIKKANQGKLHSDLGIKKGEKIPLSEEENLKKSGSPAEKKRATFAINARSWGRK